MKVLDSDSRDKNNLCFPSLLFCRITWGLRWIFVQDAEVDQIKYIYVNADILRNDCLYSLPSLLCFPLCHKPLLKVGISHMVKCSISTNNFTMSQNVARGGHIRNGEVQYVHK